MKGGIYNRPECCNQPCECPVCFESKPLMCLNCNHYICLEDILYIINTNPRRLQKCPICRVLIDSYGCNENIVNVHDNNNNRNPQLNSIGNDADSEGNETDNEYRLNDEGYDTDRTDRTNEIYGRQHKRKKSVKNSKKSKRGKSNTKTRRSSKKGVIRRSLSSKRIHV
jgi:hypothetical protein